MRSTDTCRPNSDSCLPLPRLTDSNRKVWASFEVGERRFPYEVDRADRQAADTAIEPSYWFAKSPSVNRGRPGRSDRAFAVHPAWDSRR